MSATAQLDPHDPAGGAFPSWVLRLIRGPDSWNTWPIAPQPLVVGRSLGCHICFDRGDVSRVQCEVFLHGGSPFLRNRSASNPTRVNGIAKDDTPLKLGDLIEFSEQRIIVDILPADAHRAFDIVESMPTTQSLSDCVYLQDELTPVDDGDLARQASNLLALFTTIRELADEETLDELVAAIQSHLATHLQADQCWVAKWIENDHEVLVLPVSEHSDGAPLRTIRQAIETREGQLDTTPGGCPHGVAAVPMTRGGDVIGALCVVREVSKKPFDLAQLHYLIALAKGVAPLVVAAERTGQLLRDRAEAWQSLGRDTMVGRSLAMDQLREAILVAASGHGSVLLIGETGVGKELAARLVHDQSARRNGPYVAVNCAAIPDELFESEMFGHERGAFTGATHARKGLFEQAHGGTLFLDEVGELSPTNQARLLRAAESKSFRRIGGVHPEITVDVRIVAATNRPLMNGAVSGFRPDLLHRLGVYTIPVPPLRERKEDIPELAESFVRYFGPHAPNHPKRLSPDALHAMAGHSWPGNVRELRNVVERACFRASGSTVSAKDLGPLAGAPRSSEERGRVLDTVEREHLLDVLTLHQGNVAASAEALGIAASTLYYKLRRHGISLRNPR